MNQLVEEKWTPEEWAIIQRAIELQKVTSVDLGSVFFKEQKLFNEDKVTITVLR